MDLGKSQVAWIRRLLIILAHVLLGGLAFYAAYVLRFLDVPAKQVVALLPSSEWEIFLRLLPFVVLWKVAALGWFQLFQGFWRYAGTHDLIRIIKACTASALGIVLTVVFLRMAPGFPRSVYVLDWLVSIFAFGGLRLLARLLRDMFEDSVADAPGARVLIIGAGDNGEAALRELRKHFRGVYHVIGFLDDNLEKQGVLIHGVKVLGRTSDIARMIREQGVTEVLFAISNAPKRLYRSLVEACAGQKVMFRMVPSVGDFIAGRQRLPRLREVSVEDLLGRDPVQLDREQVAAELKGRCVLVTGAGGSIGSELVRQIAAFHPARIVLFEIGESPLFEIHRQLQERFPDLPCEAVLGDIMHAEQVEAVFAAFKPELVFHAAAFKHVPMMERYPTAAVLNNLRGTRQVAEAAVRHGAAKFVLISSDKAVHPRNVMGATKRCAELLLKTLAVGQGTRFITVRFGNVLGSNGSVVPIFRQQIATGGPVRVTHPETTRYFMTIPEAVELVLQAGAAGRGGELFMLDMGEPIPILTLAKNMIELSGLTVGEDVEILFTGLRPGEKLHEELAAVGEDVVATEIPKVMRHRDGNGVDREALRNQLLALEVAAEGGQPERTLELLWQLCPPKH
ncbi:MAG: nucleoside-diphosphate sugar epimerase/dehydratase [Lentisphaeria bacterium]